MSVVRKADFGFVVVVMRINGRVVVEKWLVANKQMRVGRLLGSRDT